MKIKTKLIGREREFTALEVARRMRKPVLLVGDVGTGKTQCFLDFVISNATEEDDIFIKQVSFDTRADEVLGHISIPDFKKGIVKRVGGIASAKFVLIDEVDKANSQVRNLFLSVMRERKIFDGERIVPCQWELFVGTSNRQEFDEEDKGFIDRFLLKVTVPRLGVAYAAKLLDLEYREVSIQEVMPVGDEEVRVIKDLLLKVAEKIYQKVSDRSLASLLDVAVEFSKFYGIEKGILSAVEYVCGVDVAAEVSGIVKYKSDIVRTVESLIEDYKRASDKETKESILLTIQNEIRKAYMEKSEKKVDIQLAKGLLDKLLTEEGLIERKEALQ